MQRKKIFWGVIFCAVLLNVQAQQDPVVLAYISTFKEMAIAEMQRTGVPAAIKLAQGIHETAAGQSELVKKSNNHFGIKCKSTWTGPSVSHDDDARGECFRKYEAAENSYKDHSDFLRGNKRYAFLFELDPENFEDWAYGLKRAGYATNPKYPVILIKLIKDYNLNDYTLVALGKMKAEEVYAKNNQLPVLQQPAVSSPANNPDMENSMAVMAKISPAPVSVYPEGEFRINDTKVVYAKKGTPFLAIANQFNVPLKRIFEFNDDLPEEEVVEYDQLIFLQRKRKTGATAFHVVEPGETVYDIAQKEGIRLESLLEYNLLKETMDPAAGEKLYLQQKAPVMPRLATAVASVAETQSALFTAAPAVNAEEWLYHTVQPKETVYSIAKKYNVSTNQLQEWNQLAGHALKTGQQLRINKKTTDVKSKSS